jgi:Domain of unknown function (DUF1996)
MASQQLFERFQSNVLVVQFSRTCLVIELSSFSYRKEVPMVNPKRSVSQRLRSIAAGAASLAVIVGLSSWSGVLLPEPASAAGPVHNMAMMNSGVALPPPAAGLSYGATKPESVPIERPSLDGTGNFRTICQFSHMNYDDPLVHPGAPGAAHLHSYFGNTGANAYSTASNLLASGNSTCDGGTLNRSTYWVPSIVTPSGQTITPISNMIYYKQGYQGLTREQIVSSLPNGLQLVAGNPKATSDPGDARVVHWSCSTKSWEGRQSSIPPCEPGNTIKAEINFPQCWDGKNLSSPDFTSHMAYGGWNVGCPATHPVGIPAIAFNVEWRVPATGTTGWRLASDMYSGGEGGYSLHGDLIMAWDPATSSAWLNNCVKQNADCHVNQISDTAALIDAPRNEQPQPPNTAPPLPTVATTVPPTTAAPTTATPTTAPVTTAPVTTAPVTTAPVTTAPVTTAPPTSGSCAANRVVNPGFELGLQGWDSWGGDDKIVADAKSGSAAWSVSGRGQFIPVTAGEKLDLSVWAKAGSDGWSAIGIEFFSATDRLSTGDVEQQITSPTYAPSRLSATAPATAERARVWAWSGSQVLTVDDWCVSKG